MRAKVLKRVYRSREDKMFSGVLGGFGTYWSIDSVALRVMWTAITVMTGLVPGVIAYIAAIIIMPEAPHGSEE